MHIYIYMYIHVFITIPRITPQPTLTQTATPSHARTSSSVVWVVCGRGWYRTRTLWAMLASSTSSSARPSAWTWSSG